MARLHATADNYDFDPYPYDCPNLRDLVTAKGTTLQTLIDCD
jgi:hypothetical protein